MEVLGSPDVLSFKNFATSQSAPSYTPIVRQIANESAQSSSEENEEEDEETGTPMETTAPGQTDLHMEEEDDDDVSDDGNASNMHAITSYVPGVSVLQTSNGSSEEEEEEEMSSKGHVNQAEVLGSTCDFQQASEEDEEEKSTELEKLRDAEEGMLNTSLNDDIPSQSKKGERKKSQNKRQKIQNENEPDVSRKHEDAAEEPKSTRSVIASIGAQSALLAESCFADTYFEQTRTTPGSDEPDVPPQSKKGGKKKGQNKRQQNHKDISPKHEEEKQDEEMEEGKNTANVVASSISTQSAQLPESCFADSSFEHTRTTQVLEDPDVAADSPTPTQLVLSSTGDSWGELPPEASNAWSVQQDSCSLEVGGKLLKLPRAVFERLFFYQRQGVVWMLNLFQQGFGGLLADEMGLGKTVQVAAFLSCLKFSNQGSRFLVVVPPTLLEQWRRELKSWSADTGLAVHVMHGTQQERRAAIRGMVSRGGVMLTSYELARNAAGLNNLNAANIPKKRKKMNKRGCRDDDSPSEEEEELIPSQIAANQDGPWDTVIVDEGHQLKNPSCLVGRALRKIESRSRFLLTGTPLQNKLSDLWALMDFAQPGLLGNHSTFERNFSEQIEKGSKRNATRFAVELKDHLARELKRLTAPHFLRRLKDEVQLSHGSSNGDAPAPENLPPKTDVVLWLNLTNAQIELYNLFLGSETVRRATAGRNGMEALKAIAMLKKVCNNPLLCLPKEEFAEWRQRTVPSSKTDKTAQAPAAETTQTDALDDDDATQPAIECQDFMARLHALVPGSAEGAALLSCKLKVLAVLLPQLQKRGHRCLIFSHSTKMLDLIQACVLRVLGLKFLRIDGTIDPKERDVKVTKFQAPESRYFCMCLSSQVGGVGLTITGADRVILADPAWNPAMDAQAIDRVHRLGQTRDVVVYRLVGSGAIEDKMFRLQVFKRSLAKTAMEHESQIRFFTHKELKQLFEAPNLNTSTQALMSEQLGVEALEHEGLLNVVANDIGSTDDPDAMPFWQSSDVLGFSDYQRLFMYLEQSQKAEEEAEKKAKDYVEKLRNEEYKADQVTEGKWREKTASKENQSPQEQGAVPIANA